ncbi:hypothetical protein ABVK25_010616 [Lepraria finkii]|uniref:Uncharacterized protein n=1 Tax=Lepraria finkii TaxID=1340010 RepID=A0ABR4AU73_9LECA
MPSSHRHPAPSRSRTYETSDSSDDKYTDSDHLRPYRTPQNRSITRARPSRYESHKKRYNVAKADGYATYDYSDGRYDGNYEDRPRPNLHQVHAKYLIVFPVGINIVGARDKKLIGEEVDDRRQHQREDRDQHDKYGREDDRRSIPTRMLEHNSSSCQNSPDRHKKKQRPNPDFYDCPISGCDYVDEYDIAAKLQRRLSKVHG